MRARWESGRVRESAIITSTRDGFWELWGIPHDCSWEQHVLPNVVEVVWKICNNASGRVSVIGVAIIIIGRVTCSLDHFVSHARLLMENRPKGPRNNGESMNIYFKYLLTRTMGDL